MTYSPRKIDSVTVIKSILTSFGFEYYSCIRYADGSEETKWVTESQLSTMEKEGNIWKH